jgi:hypothetical protein
MEGLANELTMTRTEHGTTVEMRWPAPADRPGPQRPLAAEVESGGQDAEDRLRGMTAITDIALARLGWPVEKESHRGTVRSALVEKSGAERMPATRFSARRQCQSNHASVPLLGLDTSDICSRVLV